MKLPLRKLGAVAAATAILTVGALALNPRLPALASAQTITYHADASANDVSGLHPGTWIGCQGQGYQGGHTGADGDSSFAFMPFPCLPNSYIETDIEVGTFGTDPATIDFWFRGNSGTAGHMNGVLSARAYCDNPPEGWWDIRIGTSPVANNPPGTIIVEFGGLSYLNVIGQTNVMDDEWHHILVNRSDTGVSINVDGAPDGAASGPASPINPSVPMTIGRSACEDIDGHAASVGFQHRRDQHHARQPGDRAAHRQEPVQEQRLVDVQRAALVQEPGRLHSVREYGQVVRVGGPPSQRDDGPPVVSPVRPNIRASPTSGAFLPFPTASTTRALR